MKLIDNVITMDGEELLNNPNATITVKPINNFFIIVYLHLTNL